jgi:hypothetical protein
MHDAVTDHIGLFPTREYLGKAVAVESGRSSRQVSAFLDLVVGV